MMFNESMGCCAWGGGRYRVLDGVAKTWGVTWLPPWSQHHSVVAHEMGHAFGLPHSNNWDGDDLANNIQRLLTDTRMHEKLAATSAQMQSHHGPTQAAEKLDALFTQA